MTVRARLGLGVFIIATALRAQTRGAIETYLGKWVVRDVLCSLCGKRDPAEKGTIIQFAATQIHNPLAEDCASSPGYGALREMLGRQLIARYGMDWPPSVTRAISKEAKVRYGFVTCRGVNLMQMLFLSDKRSFYFFEGDIVFDLQHELKPDTRPAKK